MQAPAPLPLLSTAARAQTLTYPRQPAVDGPGRSVRAPAPGARRRLVRTGARPRAAQGRRPQPRGAPRPPPPPTPPPRSAGAPRGRAHPPARRRSSRSAPGRPGMRGAPPHPRARPRRRRRGCSRARPARTPRRQRAPPAPPAPRPPRPQTPRRPPHARALHGSAPAGRRRRLPCWALAPGSRALKTLGRQLGAAHARRASRASPARRSA